MTAMDERNIYLEDIPLDEARARLRRRWRQRAARRCPASVSRWTMLSGE